MTEETRDCAVLLDSLDRREISERPDQWVRRESLVHMDRVERKETGERDLSVSLLTYLKFICLFVKRSGFTLWWKDFL